MYEQNYKLAEIARHLARRNRYSEAERRNASSRTRSHARSRMVARSSPIQIYLHLHPLCTGRALWTTRRRYWFRPRSQSRTPLSKRVTSLQRPAKSAPPRKFAVTQIHRFALSIPTRLMCEEWRSNFVCFSFLSGEEHGYIQFDGKRIKVGICEEWRKQVW